MAHIRVILYNKYIKLKKKWSSKMNFENIIKDTDTYLYKKCQFRHVDFTSAISILHHFEEEITVNVCLTKREADWYLELADKIIFEVIGIDEIKGQEPELTRAYKNVYQAYSHYLTKCFEQRCESNLKGLYGFDESII